MSSGGIFQVINNNGKADRMITANDWLTKRLQVIRNSRRAANQSPTPTIADIEHSHVVFVNSHYKPYCTLAFEYFRTPTSSQRQWGSECVWPLNHYGDFVNDGCIHLKANAPIVNAVNATNPVYRYCDFPGERAFEKTSLNISGVAIDSYVSYDYVIKRQTELTPQNMYGYYRCMAQEIPLDVEYQQSGVAPTGSRIGGTLRNGYQTPKTVHAELEILAPLLFWFSTDTSISLQSLNIVNSARSIDVKIAEFTKMCGFEVRGNSVIGSSTLTPGIITSLDLLLCNIFVSVEIHDIFVRRIGFQMIRVHQRNNTRLENADDAIQLYNLRWPTEYIWVAYQPEGNPDVNSNNPVNGINHLDHWWRTTRVTRENVQNNPISCLADISSPPISAMGVKACGIEIYKEQEALFYNSYAPLMRGRRIHAPFDAGWHYVGFSLYPNYYQPSGHLNISRCREFYINYTSSDLDTPIDPDNPVIMRSHAQAINFVLYVDGGVTLRYST